MAITYPLTLPASPDFSRVKFLARSTVAETVSPYTGESQVQEHQGQWWEAVVEYPLMRRVQAEPVLAVLIQLKGRLGTLLLGDPDAKTPQGSAAGTPVVDGAGQTGQTLASRGWSASQNGVLRAGDYVQVGNGTTQRLHKVLKDVNADGAGKATLDIWPRLRESPADGAGIVTSDCKGVFRLASDETPWETDHRGLYRIVFAAREAI